MCLVVATGILGLGLFGHFCSGCSLLFEGLALDFISACSRLGFGV